MNILLTLDYELFFGPETGSLQRSILNPTTALLSVLEECNARATFFIDAGYLVCLERESKRFPSLGRELDIVQRHVRMLHEAGHDVQLHIHPHWEDARYDGHSWTLLTHRFRLHDFEQLAVSSIVARYRQALVELVGDGVFALRAGGWCLQPFGHLSKSLRENGIVVDSTVFEGGRNRSTTQYFDFRGAEEATWWRFGSDPIRSEPGGPFLEVPISSVPVNPLFYWKFAAVKHFGKNVHRPYGDGKPILPGKLSMLRMLFQKTSSVVSMDGYKASYLSSAFFRHERRFTSTSDNFVVIGHPKALTDHSLGQLSGFIRATSATHRFVTFGSHPENLREFCLET